TATTSPSFSASPSLTQISASLPARGATTGISIFMDSMTRITSSAAIWAPGRASIVHTLPATSVAIFMFDNLPLLQCSGYRMILLKALPELISAGILYALWAEPLRFGAEWFRSGVLTLLLEFFVIHAS